MGKGVFRGKVNLGGLGGKDTCANVGVDSRRKQRIGEANCISDGYPARPRYFWGLIC